jgi:hypothetical protein
MVYRGPTAPAVPYPYPIHGYTVYHRGRIVTRVVPNLYGLRPQWSGDAGGPNDDEDD